MEAATWDQLIKELLLPCRRGRRGRRLCREPSPLMLIAEKIRRLDCRLRQLQAECGARKEEKQKEDGEEDKDKEESAVSPELTQSSTSMKREEKSGHLFDINLHSSEGITESSTSVQSKGQDNEPKGRKGEEITESSTSVQSKGQDNEPKGRKEKASKQKMDIYLRKDMTQMDEKPTFYLTQERSLTEMCSSMNVARHLVAKNRRHTPVCFSSALTTSAESIASTISRKKNN